ncbi:hypothetical protein DFH08DRAFT_388250 [Mycena albidolilacea]|uniref:Uncharacterized protein n=1 Tax=Mycena albidolilacea TaxID=1033008 RepID=A0AAD6ZFA3_9AGAR|nr:hypothetical protein DFH08DRAFT_388250 [Mycena albidolilacea]
MCAAETTICEVMWHTSSVFTRTSTTVSALPSFCVCCALRPSFFVPFFRYPRGSNNMSQCEHSVSLPPAVESWWVATGCTEFHQHRPTITLPPPVYSWWEATGSAQFAGTVLEEVPGLVITGAYVVAWDVAAGGGRRCRSVHATTDTTHNKQGEVQ